MNTSQSVLPSMVLVMSCCHLDCCCDPIALRNNPGGKSSGVTEGKSLAGVVDAEIEDVSASIKEMSAQVEEVTSSAQALAKLAQGIDQVVAQFKVA
jgi:hypothetical protein